MKAIIVARGAYTSGHQHTWGGAFAQGLKRHGWSAKVSDLPGRCDMLVLWGVRRQDLIARQKAAGGKVCILERGYVGDRFAWTSVSFGGGLNGRAEFRGPFHDGRRWEKHFAHHMKPWRDQGNGYALIMGQVPGDMSLKGCDIDRFYERARAAFEPRMPVKFRPHPQAHPRRGAALMEAAQQSLQSDIAGAEFVVTWNSNSAVDAVLSGTPAIAMDQGSMAWDVTGHTLEPPPRPDRLDWSHSLAWCQWQMDEIASGECWGAVGW